MAKKLWGGRFTKKSDPLFERFSSSIAMDHRLAEVDLIEIDCVIVIPCPAPVRTT